MGRSADYSKQSCAIAASLQIIGEPWTLLIIRDAFSGVSRFEQWQESLGMARNVLAARLKSLVANGVFAPSLYCERPKRHEYLLTGKGRDLLPLILHLADWGERHIYGDTQSGVEVVHAPCAHKLTPVTVCAHCQGGITGDDIIVKRNPQSRSLAQVLRAEAVEDIEVVG